METIGAAEARTYWARILDEVAAGKRFVITKNGMPVAELSPPSRKTETAILRRGRRSRST